MPLYYAVLSFYKSIDSHAFISFTSKLCHKNLANVESYRSMTGAEGNATDKVSLPDAADMVNGSADKAKRCVSGLLIFGLSQTYHCLSGKMSS